MPALNGISLLITFSLRRIKNLAVFPLGDRVADLVLQFPTPLVDVRCGDTSIALTGQTVNGTEIIGSDSLGTVDCG